MSEVKRSGKLDTKLAKLENGVKRGLIEAAMIVAQRATNKAPRLTGRLKRSITHSMPTEVGLTAWYITVGINVEYAAGTNVKYAAIQEFGGKTPPHIIRPRNKKALKFDIGGETVFAKYVNHPGSNIPAQPYLRPALRESEPVVKQLLIKNIIAAFKK
jgi:HK97 gp10 family phage protein